MSEGQAPFRRMRYPYTFTAKIAQFPYKYYAKHSWLYKYWLLGIVASIPIFYQIEKLSYSPENVAKWKKLDEELLKGTGHH